MTNNGPMVWIGSAALAGLFYVWMAEGWWKAGFFVINFLFLALIWWIYRREVRHKRLWWVLWGGSLVLGGFLGIRSNELVSFLNAAGVVLINSLLAGLAMEAKPLMGFMGIAETLVQLFFNTFISIYDAVSKVRDIWPKRMGNWQKIITGVIISLPLLLLFGGLFLAADPIFAQLVGKIKFPEIRLDKIFSFRNLTTLFFFGAAAAALRQKLAQAMSGFKPWNRLSELLTATLILQGLFLVFTAVQIRYFGVTAETLREMGITFSDYTRQGYSQMIISCLLAWGIVYGLDFIRRSQQAVQRQRANYTKYLGYAFMAEIVLFIAAATKRNWLYQSAYGFTQFRLLGFWLSLWLVAIVAITFWKFWKEKDTDFLVRNIMLTTIAVLTGLNLFNIDRTIAVMRPAKLAQGVDYEYMARLSTDAWIGYEEIVSDTERRIEKGEIHSAEEAGRLNFVVTKLVQKINRLEKQSSDNWQKGGAFNWSDMKAWEYLSANKERILGIKNRLIEEENRMYEIKRKELQEKTGIYRNEVRKALEKYGFEKINLSFGEAYGGFQQIGRAEIKTADGQKAADEARAQIQKATGNNCTIEEEKWGGQSGQFIGYSISCLL